MRRSHFRGFVASAAWLLIVGPALVVAAEASVSVVESTSVTLMPSFHETYVVRLKHQGAASST